MFTTLFAAALTLANPAPAPPAPIADKSDSTIEPRSAPDDALPDGSKLVASHELQMLLKHAVLLAEKGGLPLRKIENLSDQERATLWYGLNSDNRRERQIAAWAVRDRVKPDETLLKVTIDGLRDDNLPPPSRSSKDDTGYCPVYNASDGTRYLLKHIDKAEPLLIDALQSDDLQQRFLAATVLAFGHRAAHARKIAEILIPHLKNNSLHSDGHMAAAALYRMGEPILPELESALRYASDPQQLAALRLIILAIDSHAKARADGTLDAWTAPQPVIADEDQQIVPYYDLREGSLSFDWDEMTEELRDTPRKPRP